MPRSTSTLLVVLVASSMLSACSGESRRAFRPQPSAETPAAAGAIELRLRRVELEVGHCYVEPDDGGAELTLLPADSPAVARAEAVPCR